MAKRIGFGGVLVAGLVAFVVLNGVPTSSTAADENTGANKGVAQAAEKSAADSNPADSKAAGSETAAKKARKPQRGRLPNNYGQIGLTPEQIEKIYAIQAGHRVQLQDLQKQLDELKAKQRDEIDAVLTADQRKQLAELTSKSKNSSGQKTASNAETDKAASEQ